ncbi:MAG: hypothetical protein GF315_06035 [candidate division Zixibacteria bacterium]|nr:hypothetical protein [candidate division Zixibacteria bacterium]
MNKHIIIRASFPGFLFAVLLIMSGCISWNVHTSIDATLTEDGKLQREGAIELKRFELDSLDNRTTTGIDSAKAAAYIKKHYGTPPEVDFTGYEVHDDSTCGVSWTYDAENVSNWVWDYRRYAHDSAGYSGNRIKTEIAEKFFYTDYEYQEIYYDAIVADTVIAHLPEMMPYAQEAFFDYLRNSTRSFRAQSALRRSKDALSDELVRFTNKYIKPYLYDPANWEGEESYGDSLRNETVDSLQSILRTYPATDDFTPKIIDNAIQAAIDEIGQQFENRGYAIGGAYLIGGSDRFTFAVKLNLPGRIQATNADSVGDGHVIWNFTNYEFRGKELLLYARSNQYHWVRLGIVVLLAIGVITAAVLVLKRRRL